MLIALPLAIGVVAALAFRHAGGAGEKRSVWLVAGVALAIRLAACIAIFSIARQAHDSGEWLNDESAFFKATQSLMPNPLDRQIQEGLEHLGGDGYLGLTTALALAGGGIADTNAFRVVNAAIGAAVVVLGMLVARRLFGQRAALVSGLALAVWPTLVLWSATMLRDTLGSFAVVVVWWTLGRARELGWLRTVGTVFLSLVIVLSLRPYLGGAMVAGVAAWAIYPFLRRTSARTMALLIAGAAVMVVAAGVAQARQIDFAIHELVYRRTMVRMEMLGKLYTDFPPAAMDQPIRPGAAVGLVEPGSGWVLGGIVQDYNGPDVVRVAFTDESVRDVPATALLPLESTPIRPLQMLTWVGPDVFSYLVGTSITSEPSSPTWIAVALAWDVLFVLAVVAVVRVKVSAREWLFPLFVVAGTVTALMVIPGAPGNADRHRATQTVPLLLVLASGLVSARGFSKRPSDRAVSTIITMPPTAPAPASSRIRSAR